MSVRLPDSLQLLERGWLSANNLLCFDGDRASLIDSGYVTHAEQTVALLQGALGKRRLETLINTHSHSDHIGGNAAVQSAFACEIVVPAGLQAHIAEWNEDALLLSPLGQQAARFRHDRVLHGGEHFVAGELVWEALAVPGHDMDALAYYNREKRLLISGDALWENGFGVLFPELLGQADAIASTRATLEMLGRLEVDIVIPGHGPAFATVDLALERAFGRLASFEAQIERLAWHGIKVIVAFAMMERQRIAEKAFIDFVTGLPFATDVNQRYLGLSPETMAGKVLRDLLAVGALVREDGWLRSA